MLGSTLGRSKPLFAVLGLAGANVGEQWCKASKPCCRFKNSLVYSDGVIALQGALGDHDGTVVILGTGSAYVTRVGMTFVLRAAGASRSVISAVALGLAGTCSKKRCSPMTSSIPRSPLTEADHGTVWWQSASHCPVRPFGDARAILARLRQWCSSMHRRKMTVARCSFAENDWPDRRRT